MPADGSADRTSLPSPMLVIAHRGASGERPEFASRLTTKRIDGREITGWFSEDFTLAELRNLRARERLPELRAANARFDGLYQIPTLGEIIALVRAKEAETGRRIGIIPEIKHPSYFRDIGLALEPLVVEELHAAGYRSAGDPALIQSFEPGSLERLDGMTQLRLVQLVSPQGSPADRPETSYAAMVTPEGLAAMATYADVLGAELTLLTTGEGAPTGLVEQAHAAGLEVHGWTLRKENAFLPEAARIGDDPAARGDIGKVWQALRAAGVDGVFTDDPASAGQDYAPQD